MTTTNSMVAFDLAWVLSGLLLIPYILWGIYLLRQKLTYHVELDRAVETFTIACLVFFFIFEFKLLDAWLGKSPLRLIVAVFGLSISAVALYGPLIVSFGSHLMIDIVMPARTFGANEPQYGVAEACEMHGDFEGAAREYATVARMFPRETKAALRAGDNLMKLDRPADAVPWFELALRNLDTDDSALPVLNRLVGIYQTRLGQPEMAAALLQGFLEDFPNSEYAPSVAERLANVKATPAPSPTPVDEPFSAPN